MSKGWTEQDSSTFIRDADCFVPERELLVESVCRLIPAGIESNLVVELCCGDGTLSEAILSCLEGVCLATIRIVVTRQPVRVRREEKSNRSLPPQVMRRPSRGGRRNVHRGVYGQDY